MAKVTAPIQEVSRLLDLVPFLSTHSYISLKDLAVEFGVSEREISKELAALSMCGENKFELIDVTFDSGFVTIRDHDRLDIPRALSHLEISSLLIGLELIRDGATEEHREVVGKIESLIRKLSELTGEALEIDTHPEAQHIGRIEKAMAQRSLLAITYESSLTGQSHDRTVEPLALYPENGYTYLSAYCHRAGAHRNFRLDRVLALADTEILADVNRGSETSTEKEQFTIEISGRKRAIAEHLQLNAIPTSSQCQVEAFSPAWITKTVISFAPDISLVAPVANRREIEGSLRKILALYSS